MKYTSMEKEKREGAERIFQALAGADEELLARSEESVRRIDKKTAKGSWKGGSRRGSRILAAAVCFAALGVLALGIERAEFRKGKTAEDSMLLRQEEAGMRTAADAVQEPEAMLAADAADSKEAAMAAGAADAEADGIAEAAVEGEALEEKIPIAGAGESGAGQKAETDTALMVSGTEKAEKSSDTLELSETEARAQEPFGSYIPRVIPAGYVFSAAYLNCGQEEADGPQSLFVRWTKGMDYIEIILCEKASEELSFADADAPEAQEYPVFKSSELSEAVVDARMETVEDKGDTDTPRGNFSVYYEKEQILLEFRGRGTAREIWEMLSSVEPVR